MESPESSKPNITETAHVQVSLISSFISNLSPKPNGLVTCIDKGSDSNISVNDQIGSHIEYANQLSTDVSIYPNVSSGSTIKESEYIHQPPDAVTSSKEYATELNYEHNARINEAVDLPALPRKIEHVHKENTPIHVNVIEFGMKIEPELSVSHSLTNQEKEDTTIERVDGKQAAPLDQSSYMRLGSTQTDEDNELVEATGAVLTAPILKEEQNNPKAFQHCGIRRRCLQFEDAQQKFISNHPAQNPEDSAAPKSESSGMPPGVNEKHVDSIQSKTNVSSTSQIPILLGIGLHLNTVINSVQAGSGTIPNVRSVQIGNFGIHGKKPLRILKSHLSDTSQFSSMSSPMESVSNISVNVNPVENETTSGNTSKSKTENDGISDEFNKSSAEMKRKRSHDSSDGDGCKRCNCKKSSCLKLYCECFAAGLYCMEPCTCYECWNRKEFKDTVLDRRQQIESRNPLAFTPKVIQPPIEPLISSFGGNQAQFTPLSARHKRGCNCKKSMCLKKYCECFLANVGCSDGCRCEGCRNGFGRKGEYGVIKDVHVENTSGRTVGPLVENIQLLGSGSSSYQSELQNPYNSTPLTPTFPFSNQKKDASESQYGFSSQNYFPSPESGLTFVGPYGISPVSPTVIDAVPFDPGDWSNNAKDQSVSGDRQYSSVSSFRWRGSPITPMTQYSGTKLLDVDSELSNLMQDDDSPGILQEVPTPLNTVKVSSPNKKRVSPPHHGRLFGSISSSGLTSGHKFILKSVPSFPALTPCINSKISAVEQIKDPPSLISKKDSNI